MNSNVKDELREVAAHRMDLQAKLINTQVWQTCLNCVYWYKRTIINNTVEPPTRTEKQDCRLFKAMPPPHIIVSGCPDHENDIPF